jgi:hypothetical protein
MHRSTYRWWVRYRLWVSIPYCMHTGETFKKYAPKAYFTHETESPWLLHFKHSHWLKRRSRSKFASHYAWGTNGVCECKINVKSTWISNGITWIMFHGHLDYFQKPLLGGRPDTKPGDHALQTLTTINLLYFIMRETPAWKGIHWNSIWLRDQSHMTSYYTWKFVTTLRDFGSVSGRPLDTFFWALTFTWSQLLARVEVALNMQTTL